MTQRDRLLKVRRTGPSLLGWLLLAAVALYGCTPLPRTASASRRAAGADALSKATDALCDRRVALLGEGSNHGDGETERFKQELVRRLVDECGFDVVLFEASLYEFAALHRRAEAGKPVEERALAAAVGGLWSRDRAFQPLLTFLTRRVNDGRVAVGGFDDQIGGAGQAFANDGLGPELFADLPPDRRADCAARLRRRIYYDFPQDELYSPSDRAALLGCIDEATIMPARPDRAWLRPLATSMRRWIARDLLDDVDQMQARERSMFENFRWHKANGLGARKLILWGATVHLARAPAEGTAAVPLGAMIARDEGAGAYALGFTALGGAVRQSRRQIVEVASPPPGSLEARAAAEMADEVAFFESDWLARAGNAEGAALRHRYQMADWSRLLDGLVVFRAERPTELVED